MNYNTVSTHIPQFRERKNRIVNRQDQADEEPADEALAAPDTFSPFRVFS
jgi:hypothetical protein